MNLKTLSSNDLALRLKETMDLRFRYSEAWPSDYDSYQQMTDYNYDTLINYMSAGKHEWIKEAYEDGWTTAADIGEVHRMLIDANNTRRWFAEQDFLRRRDDPTSSGAQIDIPTDDESIVY